ncbi:hypothetical protein CY34DRAFT_814538 [Suillus luteus UH-Slu-Lm8-n1]|uniref:DUF6533 domain-containing protein n=1 Tax=Suillus luteus UH-Slu-Lm8-n1 TaxID=930992 RepID=A0A0D0AI74_9AGAM|nr:hypothetical protein CY34DRAFT_814538 [Suillus luteus UH-Slu-Lm8-n1]
MPIWATQAFDGVLAHTHLSNMTYVSNDPSWWPWIAWDIVLSYWIVAAGVVVVYDWVLTIGMEIELIWVSDGVTSYKQENTMNLRQRQRWSLMTVLYLVIRYIGISYSVYASRPKIGVVLIAHI